MEQSSRKFRIDWLQWSGAGSARWQGLVWTWLTRHAIVAMSIFAFAASSFLFGPGLWRRLRLGQRVRRARLGEGSGGGAAGGGNSVLASVPGRGERQPPRGS